MTFLADPYYLFSALLFLLCGHALRPAAPLIVVSVLCLCTDLQSRKVYNIVTVPAVLAALLYYGAHEGTAGLLFCAGGALTGAGLLLPFYIAGGMGGGDVKLTGALGAWGGILFIADVMIYGGIAGGLVGMVVLIYKRAVWATLKRCAIAIGTFLHPLRKTVLPRAHETVQLPFGAILCLGSIAVIAQRAMA